ncbi:MAG: hypothetical protein ACEY3D_06520 [Rickettsia sp.]|uniref:hypothetical protein n=1 Tax=Rickettsia sp. TaxID=789 RepID=UPI00397C5756
MLLRFLAHILILNLSCERSLVYSIIFSITVNQNFFLHCFVNYLRNFLAMTEKSIHAITPHGL